MKNIYKFLAVALFATSALFPNQTTAQSPDKMSYQAIIRNGDNNLLKNHNIGMQISILQGSAIGVAVYVERHYPTTNSNGLVTTDIGAGTVISGNFNNIDWANGPYYLKNETDIDGGANYTISGTSQLMSVPYALHAKTAENVTGGITETDPVFVASAAAGITGSNITNWNNKLASEVDGSITNEIQTLSINGYNLTLSNGGGTIILPQSTSTWAVKGNLNNASVLSNTTWAPIGPTFTFTKQSDDTNLEIYVNTNADAGTFQGATGIRFQVRVDGIASSLENQGAIKVGGQIEFLSFMSIFTNLDAGNYTIQVYTRTNTGASWNVILDPGGWGGSILVKETQ